MKNKMLFIVCTLTLVFSLPVFTYSDVVGGPGDELAADFGLNGLWHYNGTDWTQLNAQDAEEMEEWDGGLAADFGASGLWNYDGYPWELLTTQNSEGMKRWSDGLAVDFNGDGLWNYNGLSWDLLTSVHP